MKIGTLTQQKLQRITGMTNFHFFQRVKNDPQKKRQKYHFSHFLKMKPYLYIGCSDNG